MLYKLKCKRRGVVCPVLPDYWMDFDKACQVAYKRRAAGEWTAIVPITKRGAK